MMPGAAPGASPGFEGGHSRPRASPAPTKDATHPLERPARDSSGSVPTKGSWGVLGSPILIWDVSGEEMLHRIPRDGENQGTGFPLDSPEPRQRWLQTWGLHGAGDPNQPGAGGHAGGVAPTACLTTQHGSGSGTDPHPQEGPFPPSTPGWLLLPWPKAIGASGWVLLPGSPLGRILHRCCGPSQGCLPPCPPIPREPWPQHRPHVALPAPPPHLKNPPLPAGPDPAPAPRD